MPVVFALALCSLAAYAASMERGPTLSPVVLHTFAFADGLDPQGPLTFAADGAFYGTMNRGGYDPDGQGDGAGTVFRFSPDGVFDVLHAFGDTATDAANPIGKLVQTPDGRLWGVTERGGDFGGGAIFTMRADGLYQVVHSFGAVAGESSPEGGLVLADDGLLYGTLSGGLPNAGIVYRIDPATLDVATMHTFHGGGTSPAAPVGSLVQATDGALYGVTSSGGLRHVGGGGGTIFRMTPDGKTTTLHKFSADEGCSPLGGMIQGSDGLLYGTTAFCGASTHGGSVFAMTLGGDVRVLHRFTSTHCEEPWGVSLTEAPAGTIVGTINEGLGNCVWSVSIAGGWQFGEMPAGLSGGAGLIPVGESLYGIGLALYTLPVRKH